MDINGMKMQYLGYYKSSAWLLLWGIAIGLMAFIHMGVALAQEQKPSIFPAFGIQATTDQVPEFAKRKRLLFLTTIDFPPFNFVGDDKELKGFHVDLAHALCEELNYSAVCQIQALPWQELLAALENKKGDAIISGIGITKETRRKLLFTRSYFQFPGRFLVKKDNVKVLKSLWGQSKARIGSLEASAHQAYAKTYFKGAIHLAYSSREKAIEALNKNEINLFFDDGLSIARLLNDQPDICLCEMADGAYFSKSYFGQGLSIAMKQEDMNLKTALDWGLSKLHEKGILQELYLRHFPIGIF